VPLGFLLSVVIIGQIGLRLDGVPYNVKELLQRRPTTSLLLIGVVLLACGCVFHAAACVWQRRPVRFAALSLPAACLLGLLTFLLLSLAVPTESFDDLVGYPVLGIGATLERCLRFTGLFAGPLACGILGVRLALGNYNRDFLIGLPALFALLVASYAVVVPLADTDNIVELLRADGRSPSAVGLPIALVLLSLVSTRLAAGFETAMAGSLRPLAVAALAAVCCIPLSWLLFTVATSPRIEKYGQAFSARQFLFSPDRQNYLGDGAIFARFAIVHLLAIGAFAAGILTARLIAAACRRVVRE